MKWGSLLLTAAHMPLKTSRRNSDTVSRSLASIAPGDTGAALFDALHAAVAMFEKAPSCIFYPDSYEFDAVAPTDGGYEVTIQIPFERATA
jgi:hypothetical protein